MACEKVMGSVKLLEQGNARLDSQVLMFLPWGLRQVSLKDPTKRPSAPVPVKPRQLSCGT